MRTKTEHGFRGPLHRAGVAFLAAALAGCAAGGAAFRDAERALERGDLEDGIAKLEQAVKEAPTNNLYRLELRSKRDEAVRALIAEADRARTTGEFDAALTAYRRVLVLESGNERAQRGLELVDRARRHRDTTAQAQKDFDAGRLDEAAARVGTVLAEDPGAAPAVALRGRIDAARGPYSATPRLRTRDNRPVTLQFRDAPTKMVFEVLSRQTGINFIFDKEVKSDGKTTIYVQDVAIEQAIDLVLGQNQLARQILASNMVMIYPATAAKQREYQDQIVRTFYMTNADPKRTMDMLKTMLNAKTLFVDERASAVIMRDTPEAIRMAERLIASVDVANSEVMMEVEVLEITRSKLQQLGIRYPNAVTLTPTALAGDPLVLRDLQDQDSTTIKVSAISATVDLQKEVGLTNVLASPRIRARNREQAKILIGQRVPVITNSVTPTSSGAAVVTGNVQYVDVGLKLEVEPTISLENDVTIKVALEVSSIIREISNGTSGTLAYQIGTRNASTVLSLKDGETQILAGLINDQDRRTSTHVPGVGDMPLLGRLFGSRKTDTEKTEIVLSITPRVIRSQPRPSSADLEFYVGTEAGLRSSPLSGGGGAAPAAAGPAGPANSGVQAPPAESEASVADPAARPTLSWNGPGEVTVGQEFEVRLNCATTVDLTNIRSTLRFDAAALELLGADVGSLIPADLREASRPLTDPRTGRAQISVSGGTVTGEGDLIVLRFKAISPRPITMVTVQQFGATSAAGAPVPAMAPRPLAIIIQP